ncbi:hypothetical protein ACFW1P_31095 [Paenibacillus sp. NPDC058910]|uniref:hypothetical protein n=1 Tax=unclassified Paenibacillus TaxID=185978 RepID=UPI00368E3FDB
MTKRKTQQMEPKTTFRDIPKVFAVWLFKQRRRYISNKKIEWMVQRLIQGFLLMWDILFYTLVYIDNHSHDEAFWNH